jgi:hypothetical protein
VKSPRLLSVAAAAVPLAAGVAADNAACTIAYGFLSVVLRAARHGRLKYSNLSFRATWRPRSILQPQSGHWAQARE